MIFTSRIKRNARARTAALLTIIAAFAGASSAHAELVRRPSTRPAYGPPRPGVRSPAAEQPPEAAAPSIAWTPTFVSFAIGASAASGLSSFGALNHLTLKPMEAPRDSWSLCLGVTCGLAPGVDLEKDPKTALSASTRAITSIGPIAVTALALFASPTLKKDRTLAMSVAPMFALGGGGIELHGVWW